jgi:hypothetical protein
LGSTPKVAYLGSLIELESCIHLKHPRCWNPKSRLKSAREEGAGLGQITRAFKPDGSIRFDALSDLKYKYPKELYELNWQVVYDRPDLQIRALALMMRDNYQAFDKYVPDKREAYAFADAAYNGGLGGVNHERRACKLASWCDPNKWFDNVEKLCLKSKVALYGNRSACDINREHVEGVLNTRSTKYTKYLN